MDITFFGAGTVRLSGKAQTILCDPFGPEAGLGKLPSRINVVTKSGPEGFGEVPEAQTFDSPGEFEIGGVMITGVQARLNIDESEKRGTIFAIKIDGINVVVLGNVAPDLSQGQIEPLGTIDVLVIPVGGHGLSLEPADAAQLVARLEPSYVIPVHFDDGATKYPVPQDGVELFLKEVGSHPEEIAKLKVNIREMPAETEVVLLKNASA